MTCSKTARCEHHPVTEMQIIFYLNLTCMHKPFCYCLVQHLASDVDKNYPVTLSQPRLLCMAADTSGAPSFCKSAHSGQQLDPAVICSPATPPKGQQNHPVFSSRAGHSSAGRTEQLYRRKWGKTLLIWRISWQEFACWRLQLRTHSLRLTLWGLSWKHF